MTAKLSLIYWKIIFINICLGVWAYNASAEPTPAPIELNFAIHAPEKHKRYRAILAPWIKMVEEKTGNKIKITPHFKQSLLRDRDSWDGIRKGTADLGHYHSSDMPGRFPLVDMAVLPGSGLTHTTMNDADSHLASMANWAAYEKFSAFQQEFSENKLLVLHVSNSIGIHTLNKQIHRLEDLKGLKIAVNQSRAREDMAGIGPVLESLWLGSPHMKALKLLGASPVMIRQKKLLPALKSGEIDGVMTAHGLLVNKIKLADGGIKYSLVMDGGKGSVFFLAMNWNTWNKLPVDVKSVLEQYTGAWLADYISKRRDAGEQSVMEKASKAGIEFNILSPQEQARWARVLAPISSDYAAELDSKGLPGSELVTFYKEYVKTYRQSEKKIQPVAKRK